MQPTVAVMMLLPNCNMTCSFCITENTIGTFSFEQAVTLLRRLRDEGFRSLVIGGGEPLVWPHGLIRLTQLAKDYGLVTQVGTNGALLPDGFERLDSIDRFVLPLDGATAEIHNAVRFYRCGHFEIIMARLARLRDAGKSTTISTVITRVNREEIRNICALLLQINHERSFLHAWHLYQFIPEGRGGGVHRDELLLSDHEYSEICNGIKNLDPGFTVFKRPDMLRSKTVEFFWMKAGQLHRQLGDREMVQAI